MTEAEDDDDDYSNEFILYLEETRNEELESLKVIYVDDPITFKTHGTRHLVTVRYNRFVIDIMTLSGYPCDLPVFICGNGLSAILATKLRAKLSQMANSLRGSVMLFELIEEARSILQDSGLASEDSLPFNTNAWIESFDASETAMKYMGGITMNQITDQLSHSGVATLHAELVLNNMLVQNFERMRRTLEAKYESHPRCKSFLNIEVAFHGTRREYVPNIISRGFVKPGDVMNKIGDTLQVRSGSRWGRGIYLSPDPMFSIHYTDYTLQNEAKRLAGRKLFVCAVLRGRPYHCTTSIFDAYMNQSDPHQGYDSNTSPSEWEYVLFDSAQVLPLYILHIKRDSDDDALEELGRRQTAGPPQLLRPVSMDVREERKKTGIREIDESDQILTRRMKQKIMTQMAKKHFPLGYGPAIGDRFVVEEIGQVDDDEEEWGEYQLDRHGYERQGEGIHYSGSDSDENEEKASQKRLDEFQRARKGISGPKFKC